MTAIHYLVDINPTKFHDGLGFREPTPPGAASFPATGSGASAGASASQAPASRGPECVGLCIASIIDLGQDQTQALT